MEKDRITRIEEGSTDAATILKSGAGPVRLSKTTEAAVASGQTITLEQYRAAQAERAVETPEETR